MPNIEIATCNGCGRQTKTVLINGAPTCFDCMEPAYQVLATEKSRSLTERGNVIEVDHIGIYRVREGVALK